MKTLYFDKTELKECVSVFVKDARIVFAGTTVNAMSVKHKNAEYDRFAEEYGIHFLFADNVPAVDFYAVPQLDLFATDGNGGLFGMVGGETSAPVCFLDADRNCYLAASNLKEFVVGAENWKHRLQPYHDIMFYNTKEEAEKDLDFILPYEAK